MEISRPREKEALRVLARNHGKWDDSVDKFSIISMKDQLEMINRVITMITVGVAVLAGIALLVAAIGIMNIMLVSVEGADAGDRHQKGPRRQAERHQGPVPD